MKYYSVRITLLIVLIDFALLLSCSNDEAKKQIQTVARPTVPVLNGERQIGTQIWMTKNLNVSCYRNGDIIPQVTDPTQWANLTTGAWCYYNNSTANGTTYGKLYNWYAVAGIYDDASLANPALRKKLAPNGWHIPTNGEWSNLINYLDPNADGGNAFNIAGGKMKEIGTSNWLSPNTYATNSCGFKGLPGGCRPYDGTFYVIGQYGSWWSSAENGTANAWSRNLSYDNGNAGKGGGPKKNGFSVRCVKD